MQLTYWAAALLPLAVSIAASPLSARADGPGTAYQCTPKGSGAARKKALEKLGANAQDLAITIEETGCAMSGTAYPLGDSSPGGAPKTGDSANFGLFKNNWGMIRSHCSQFKGQTSAQWLNGKVLNTNDGEAIKCQHEQIAALGNAGFYYSQRGGGEAEAVDYTNAINFVENYLNQGHLSDDWVTYYTLHAI